MEQHWTPLRGVHVVLGSGHGHHPIARTTATAREGGFAGICCLYGLIFGTGENRVLDSVVFGGHSRIRGFGKQSGGRMAIVRQIVG